jgi:hypothetical protein
MSLSTLEDTFMCALNMCNMLTFLKAVFMFHNDMQEQHVLV